MNRRSFIGAATLGLVGAACANRRDESSSGTVDTADAGGRLIPMPRPT